ncbi:MAG: type II toxin-antitoxin system VapC family toxin [Deltaproteobacteria bacterium]|nr:type II toxin-antitoxin system VapC family toxin [Deltaproteobacteria bacterium]
MKPALVDTDILSLFFRNNENVVSNFKAYLKEHEKINISIITYYEILSGLSADLYARLRKTGQMLDDIDILIAGVAIANNLVFATRNKNHFERIKELKIADWSE